MGSDSSFNGNRDEVNSRWRRTPAGAIVLLVLILIIWKVLGHQSADPWILGYSLSFLVAVLSLVGTLLFVWFLFHRFGARGLNAIVAIALTLLLGGGIVELFAHLFSLLRPSYEVLFLEPERTVGWKLVPNLRWTWTGNSFAAFEFSVPVSSNSLGFRDRDHHKEKPQDTVRIAVLGDSFVEAQQVPYERTAVSVLERRLNEEEIERIDRKRKYEVFNFGLSNFSVGQYLLTWDEYVKAYQPDYAFALLSALQMDRTTRKEEFGGFKATSQRKLWIRPVFNLEGPALVLEEARDFDRFLEMQRDLIENEFHGGRIKRRPVGFLLARLPELVGERLKILQQSFQSVSVSPTEPTVDQTTLQVNIRVMQELQARMRASGVRLVIADAVVYHGGGQSLSDRLRRVAMDSGMGYIALSDEFSEAERRGQSMTWRRDGHYSEEGNRVFGDAMYRWLAEERQSVERRLQPQR